MISVDEYRYSTRKTLAVCIDAFGRVIVRVPKGCSQQRIDKFLADKATWIERHSKARKERAAILLPTTGLDGYEMPYLGEKLTLCLADVKRVKAEEGMLYLPKQNSEVKLRAWLKKQALSLLKERTMYWQQKMGVQCTSVKISGAKRKWGSCSSKDEIRYTYRLLYAPLDLVDYVVVHELSHIPYKNHSIAFWQEVGRYLPDYAARRARLKSMSVILEIF